MVVNFIGIIYFETKKKRKHPEEPNIILLEWCHDISKKTKMGSVSITGVMVVRAE